VSIFPTKILLATDGSEEAELAAATAADLAKSTGSELDIIHVLDVEPWRFPPDERGNKRLEELKERGRKLLDEQVEKIQAGGGSVAEAHTAVGRSADVIVAYAEDQEAELIVLGSRGREGIRRALMGSVSDAVVRHAHCPVLVVRREEDGEPIVSSKKVLLATDGSEEAELASEAAVDLAGVTRSELHVITVGGTYHPGAAVTVDPSLLEETLRELERAARELLDEQVKKIKESGGTISEAHVEMGGAPDQQIVVLGEEIGAGLNVMGSRGLGGMRRTLLGSVSDSVMRHAHCPVLVVRREK
jgi:nucleotide-binding universal stress UspA family protein